MVNEIIFLLQAICMGICALICLRLGQAALTGFISIACILANLFVIKQIILCGYTATASDAFSIGAVLGLNLLQEYYDRASAQKAIIISFVLLIFYCIVSQLHLAYDPCITDTMHAHYAAILGWMPRIIISSVSVYLTVQYIDAWFYGFLKQFTNGRYLVVRNVLSVAICQLLDTVFFGFLAFYGVLDNITEIITVSYTIKLAAIGLSIPFIGFSKKIVSTPKSPNSL
jgi:uncharacterized integral membrane protein (TIGR00697 family)